MTSNVGREYGVVILLDALGTSQRIKSDVDKFIADWDSVLDKISQNVDILERELASRRYRTEIIIKDIFDNIQIFFPTDDPDKLDKKAIGVPYQDKSNIGRFKSATDDKRDRGNVWFIPYTTWIMVILYYFTIFGWSKSLFTILSCLVLIHNLHRST